MNSPPSIEGDSGDEFYESPEESIAEADQLLERDFESQYEQMFKERYSGMCKDELVEQCVELEKTLQSTQEAAADEIARLKAEIESLKQDKDPQTNGLDETSLPSQYHATELWLQFHVYKIMTCQIFICPSVKCVLIPPLLW